MDDRLDAEEVARELGRGRRARLRAGVRDLEGDVESGEALAGGERLLAPALGQLALGVRRRIVRLGVAVSEEPELLRHARSLIPLSAAVP